MKYILLFALFAAPFCLTAQAGLSGQVTDTDGAPLSFATIFVKETGSGATTNEEGRYEIRLQPGSYTLVFQFLGYETASREVRVGSRFEQLNVSLKPQALQLEEVEVVDGEENPAYTVMRKAIAKASYHRQQLSSYTAEVYIKGTGRLLKAPALLRSTMEEEGIDSSFAFTTESVSEIAYEHPGVFRERVISVYSTGNDNSTSPAAFINGSFYEPEIGEAVSPLSPRAFAYYRFEHAGFFLDRGFGVNKIKVIPRSPGDRVFEGEIYIIEDLWSIYSLDMQTQRSGFTVDINQVYAPVEAKAWLPVSHQFEAVGSVLGFIFEYKYLATVSGYDITLNPDLDVTFTVIDEDLEPEPATRAPGKSPQERLELGQELSRKELRKLMREYEKEARKEQDEPEVVEERYYEIDSTAYRKDADYWAEVRPVPLTPIEVRSYARLDSLSEAKDSIAGLDSLELEGNDFGLGFVGGLIGGSSYKLGEGQVFAHSALWSRTLFNPVEGFSLHTDLSYALNRGNTRFSATATPRYAFGRKALTGKGELGLSYGGNGQHRTALEGGRYVHRYNGEQAIDFFFNTYVNLFTDRNFIRIFEKDYLKLSHRHTLHDNWSINVSAEWARRYRLENITRQVWVNYDDRSYASNTPQSLELISSAEGLPETERAMIVQAAVEARPWQKYRAYNGERQPIAGTSPTLTLRYRQGLSGVFDSQTDYALLEAGVKQQIDIGARGRLDFRVDAGLFLHDRYAGFADYRHFAANQLNLTLAAGTESYRLLPYYIASTRDRYLSAAVQYQFRKLLATQFSRVQMLGIKENVFADYLITPSFGSYYEVGYSLDNVLRLFRIELAFSFDEQGYRDWGILMGVATGISTGSDGSFSLTVQ